MDRSSTTSRRRCGRFVRALSTLLLLAAGLGACDDDVAGPGDAVGPGVTETGVVVNSIDLSLTLFPVDSPRTARTLGLGPDGSPVDLAARDGLAVVPMGTAPVAQVVDLAAGEVVHPVPLPEGSGATGVAFVDDSLALVANPNLNTVSAVNVRSGTAGPEIAVGRFPQHVARAGGRLFVLNAELGPDFQPDGPGTVTVLSPSLEVVETVTLSGENPGGAALGPDGRLYVINSGRFGEEAGSLSVVDPATLEEVEHHEGFGSFPGAPTFGPDGRLYVPSFSFGIAIWDPESKRFIRAPNPEDAVTPGGVPSTAGVAFDSRSRAYALEPECAEPARVFRLRASFEVDVEIPAGTCPVDIVFTAVAR